jgi:hypothetical protein
MDRMTLNVSNPAYDLIFWSKSIRDEDNDSAAAGV